MAGSTFTWIGGSGAASVAANWSPSGGPQPGDTAIVPSGTVVLPTDQILTGNTYAIGGTSGTTAALSFSNDQPFSLATPALDTASIVDLLVPGVTTAETMLLLAAGTFINQGSILADGPAGSSSTILLQHVTAPLPFISEGLLSVSAGNLLTVSGSLPGAGIPPIGLPPDSVPAELLNDVGTLLVQSGGTLVTNGTSGIVNISGTAAGAVIDGTWMSNNGIDIGKFGSGSLDIGANGLVDSGANLVDVGPQIGGNGTVSVESGGTLVAGGLFVSVLEAGISGLDDFANNAGEPSLTAGTSGGNDGVVTLASNALVQTGFVGDSFGGTISVTGGSLISNGGGIAVNGGTLSVQSGGLVSNTGVSQPGFQIASGVVVVNGGTLSTTVGAFSMGGSSDTATLLIEGGGTLVIGSIVASINATGSGTAMAAISGGTLDSTGAILVGTSGSGSLDVNSDGLVSAALIEVGPPSGGTAALSVESGSTLTTGSLSVGSVPGLTGATGTSDPLGLNATAVGMGATGPTGAPSVTGATGPMGPVAGGTVTIGPGGHVQAGSVSENLGGTISVNGGNLTAANGFAVGDFGSAVLTVQNGGLVSNTGTAAFNVGQFGGSGTVFVNGGTLQSTAGQFLVGNSFSSGTLLIEGGGTLITGSASPLFATSDINATAGGTAAATISGGTWVLNGELDIGLTGDGSLDINSNGIVNAGANGVTVADAQTSSAAAGTLSLESGGTLIAGAFYVGGVGAVGATGATGATASTGDAASAVTNGPTGAQGPVGVVAIGSGALVNVGAVFDGIGGTISVTGGTLISGDGITLIDGVLTIGSLGLVSNTGGGFSIGSSISPPESELAVTVDAGGTLSDTGAGGMQVGDTFGSSGTLAVNGGTVAAAGGAFTLGGSNASGTLIVNNGGSLLTGTASAASDINATGSGAASASLTNGAWSTNGELIVGDGGNGNLGIASGSTVNAGGNALIIANQANSHGDVAVVGPNAELAAGSVIVSNAGLAFGTLTVDSQALAAFGALTVGSYGSAVMNGGTLSVTGVALNAGFIAATGTIIANLTNNGVLSGAAGQLEVTGSLSGSGSVFIGGGGTVELDGGISAGQSVSFLASSTPETLQLSALSSPMQSFGLLNWQTGDELVIANGATVTGAQWLGNGTLAVATNSGTYDFTSVTLAAGTTPIFSTGANFVELVSCFRAGTRIGTTHGDVPVEDLREGGRITVILGGRIEPIVWIGHRWVDCRRHPKPEQVWPVRISTGAFGGGRPLRDLWLSPDHAVYIGGVLIPIKYLINGRTITQVPMHAVDYYHIELPRHAVLLADGLPAESYLDVGDKSNFANGTGPIALYPDFASRAWEAKGCAPLVVTGPAFEAVRRRVNLRAIRAA